MGRGRLQINLVESISASDSPNLIQISFNLDQPGSVLIKF